MCCAFPNVKQLLMMQVFTAASKTGVFQLLILVFLHMFSTLKISNGLDTISSAQPLSGNKSLVSKGEKFELGFFSPGNSTNFYLGIWYKYIPVPTIVWVANREVPIRQFSNESQLVLAENGTLILFNDLKEVIWALVLVPTIVWVANSTSNSGSVPNYKGVLLDTGNFILSDGLSIIWQSFDYPTDTWLTGGKLGVLTSWSKQDDPAPGNFSLGMDPNGSAEFFAWKNQKSILWRSGAWNGHDFASFRGVGNNFSYNLNSETNYFTYNSFYKNSTSRYVLDSDGQVRQFLWSEKYLDWQIMMTQPADQCNIFATCGAAGVCNINNSTLCSCFPGFRPKSANEWAAADWSGGCNRIMPLDPLDCNNAGYILITGMSNPANSQSLALKSAVVCELACSANCSCNAYAYSKVGGCLLWTGDLLDTRTSVFSQVDLYLKIPGSRLLNSQKKKHSDVPVALSITIPLLISITFIYLSWHYWRIWRNKHKEEGGETNKNLLFLNVEMSTKKNTDSNNITIGNTLGGDTKNFNLPQFSFSSISAATDNFSPANKLGEGGFGPVYKGNLIDGHSVAVKRLSKRSGQGLEELRNETVLIAKLQHRNLVRLLGCCIEQEEKILIYEYMSNKSLDCFIFDPSKQEILDWRIRVQIIEGIAQGLLYLHQHSRLRIVHRDLKASNILLDDEMNPKISDFGMARIFGGDVLEANTNRIVGTYGYMSPEYAMEGLFSIKSDVFAFGVLLLEILSGKKNTGFRHSDCLSLLGYAWELWTNDRVLELIDSNLEMPSSSFLPLRFIHVGLLCVQESPADRPTMSDVLAMFSNEHMQLVSPKRPAFTSGGSSGSRKDKDGHFSVNHLTTSLMVGR